MADKYGAPFGAYAAVGGHVDATAKPIIAANFVLLKALFIPVKGQPAAHPDFQNISPDIAAKIGAEIDAIAAGIAASLN